MQQEAVLSVNSDYGITDGSRTWWGAERAGTSSLDDRPELSILPGRCPANACMITPRVNERPLLGVTRAEAILFDHCPPAHNTLFSVVFVAFFFLVRIHFRR